MEKFFIGDITVKPSYVVHAYILVYLQTFTDGKYVRSGTTTLPLMILIYTRMT